MTVDYNPSDKWLKTVMNNIIERLNKKIFCFKRNCEFQHCSRSYTASIRIY